MLNNVTKKQQNFKITKNDLKKANKEQLVLFHTIEKIKSKLIQNKKLMLKTKAFYLLLMP